MADKDYKVQVGVEATANTGALDKVNKGLDSLRQTARQVNDELGREETIDNLEEVADAAEDTAEAIDKTTDSAEGLQGAVSQVGQQARTTGNDVAQAGDKGAASLNKMGAQRQADAVVPGGPARQDDGRRSTSLMSWSLSTTVARPSASGSWTLGTR